MRDGDQCIADPCLSANCGNNGSCVVTAANEALCVCDQGYMRDGDQCIADPCLNANCGDNGSCVVTAANEALCVCNQDTCETATNA